MPLPDPDPPRNVVRRLVDWPDSLVLPHAPHHIVVSSFDMAADGLDTHRYRGADLSGSTRTGWRGGACASMVTTPPWLSEWGFREHVNPVDGRGNGSDDFSRTAALLIDRPRRIRRDRRLVRSAGRSGMPGGCYAGRHFSGL